MPISDRAPHDLAQLLGSGTTCELFPELVCQGLQAQVGVAPVWSFPAPTHLRMDNGPEFITHALQEWCAGSGDQVEYIPPSSPRENPSLESFNSRLRDEFLNSELFSSVAEAQMLAEQHRMEYNVYRPHSALQGHTPLVVLQQWKAA